MVPICADLRFFLRANTPSPKNHASIVCNLFLSKISKITFHQFTTNTLHWCSDCFSAGHPCRADEEPGRGSHLCVLCDSRAHRQRVDKPHCVHRSCVHTGEYTHKHMYTHIAHIHTQPHCVHRVFTEVTTYSYTYIQTNTQSLFVLFQVVFTLISTYTYTNT